ncbi:MAG: hypothetical protein JWM87_1120 [Candidatus Eremiobacteraeota bacterium]|nr:hypothetical protein [Candidatus Eremiobacteraeota bacterium]
MDLRTERYRVLDDTAGLLWAVLTGDDDALASSPRYDVGDAEFRAELDRFAQRCVDEGLLQRAGTEFPPRLLAAHRRRRLTGVPPVLRALSALVATQRALSGAGFRATYERYALLPVESGATGAGAALRSFVRAENFFVVRRAPDDCLGRSLALYRFLRSVGIAAEHVIGVRRCPFGAHAWVECQGAALLGDAYFGLTPLARIGAPHAAGGAPP